MIKLGKTIVVAKQQIGSEVYDKVATFETESGAKAFLAVSNRAKRGALRKQKERGLLRTQRSRPKVGKMVRTVRAARSAKEVKS